MNVIDISPDNTEVYRGCEISVTKNRKFLITPPEQANVLVTANLARLLRECKQTDDKIAFTGAMSPWVYLLAGTLARSLGFREIRYTDNKTSFALVNQ